MKELMFYLSALALLTSLSILSTSVRAQSFVQLAPVTDVSTIVCSNFAKQPDSTWKALAPVPFSLGIITGIIPSLRAIKSSGWIYNNVDLWTQLNYQCGAAGAVVTVRY